MKTGNTEQLANAYGMMQLPQWSPVMKTGNTRLCCTRPARRACLNGVRS